MSPIPVRPALRAADRVRPRRPNRLVLFALLTIGGGALGALVLAILGALRVVRGARSLLARLPRLMERVEQGGAQGVKLAVLFGRLQVAGEGLACTLRQSRSNAG